MMSSPTRASEPASEGAALGAEGAALAEAAVAWPAAPASGADADADTALSEGGAARLQAADTRTRSRREARVDMAPMLERNRFFGAAVATCSRSSDAEPGSPSRTRTGTLFRARDFKSPAYTIPPRGRAKAIMTHSRARG